MKPYTYKHDREKGMPIVDKAAIRIKHWMEHNGHHVEEYDSFARQLEESGFGASAKHIREMAELTRKSDECLRKALIALDKS